MSKIDFKRKLECYKASEKNARMVEVPAMNYLTITGAGNPASADSGFQQSAEALSATAYAAKAQLKDLTNFQDYVMPPLEAIWWTTDGLPFDTRRPGAWAWKLMLMQPESVSLQIVQEAIASAAAKKNSPFFARILRESLPGGQAAQILHVGPYSEEGPTIDRLFAYIADQQCVAEGWHHEIYLNDLSRVTPDKLKTILRRPCRPY